MIDVQDYVIKTVAFAFSLQGEGDLCDQVAGAKPLGASSKRRGSSSEAG